MVFSVAPSWRSSFAYCHHSGIRMKFLFVNEVSQILQDDRGSIKKAKLRIVFTLLRKVSSIRQTGGRGQPSRADPTDPAHPSGYRQSGRILVSNLGYRRHRKSSDKLKQVPGGILGSKGLFP